MTTTASTPADKVQQSTHQSTQQAAAIHQSSQQSSQQPVPNHSQSTAQGCLYVVATPIGNLGDMTTRSIDILNTVDIIACEDTRTSGKLLAHFAIPTPTWAYHEHNAAVQTSKLIEMMQSGKSVALISDAGTPLISDPGYQLLQQAHHVHIPVSPIVGACAAIAALSVAGLPSDRFSFIGFLPAKSQARQNKLADYASLSETLICYEAPHRIQACLTDMVSILGGEREITFCRELTKTFETVRKSSLADLLDFVSRDPNQQKGEIVLVIAGNPTDSISDISQHDALLQRLRQDLSVKKAAALAAELTGVKKNALYQRLLQLQS